MEIQIFSILNISLHIGCSINIVSVNQSDSNTHQPSISTPIGSYSPSSMMTDSIMVHSSTNSFASCYNVYRTGLSSVAMVTPHIRMGLLSLGGFGALGRVLRLYLVYGRHLSMWFALFAFTICYICIMDDQ